MSMTEIPDEVRRFIVETIDSVPELEALLLLRADPARTWSVDQAGARLYVSETVANHVLGSLAARGLIAQDGPRYRYAPARADLDEVVSDLATTYAASLIAVTRLIHSKPAPSVLEFANAFRLRKEP
jgi:hypothetical protein